MNRFIYVILASSAAIGLAACGGSGIPNGGARPQAITGFGPVTAGANADQHFATGASTLKFYNVGSDPNLDVNGLDIFDAQDGNLYYTTIGPATCNPSGFCLATAGTFGQFNPNTKTFVEIGITDGAPQGVYMTPDGAVWGAINSAINGTIGSLVRFSPFSPAGETQIQLPSETGAQPEPRDVTFDAADSNVYFTDKFGHRVGNLPEAGPYITSSMTMYAVPNGPPGTPGLKASPHGLSSASNGNVYFGDYVNGTVYKLTTTGKLTGYVTPQQIALGPNNIAGAAYARVASNGRIYVTVTAGGFDAMSSHGAFTTLPSAPNAVPYFERTGFGLVVWDDLANGAIGIYTLATGAVREIPTAPAVGSTLHIPNGVVPTSSTGIWFTCYGPVSVGKSLCVGHLVLTSKWSVFPSTTLKLKRGKNPTQQLIGIGESGNSGPFTVTATDPTIVSVSPVANLDHNFFLSPAGSKTGTTTVTVTDAHGVSVPITVTVL